jgi:hypothetical protein
MRDFLLFFRKVRIGTHHLEKVEGIHTSSFEKCMTGARFSLNFQTIGRQLCVRVQWWGIAQTLFVFQTAFCITQHCMDMLPREKIFWGWNRAGLIG